MRASAPCLSSAQHAAASAVFTRLPYKVVITDCAERDSRWSPQLQPFTQSSSRDVSRSDVVPANGYKMWTQRNH